MKDGEVIGPKIRSGSDGRMLNDRLIDARLQALRILRDEGTITATAEVLRTTPSTVSQQLRQLAKDLNITLLEADGRRVRLTAAAHALLRHADLVLAQWERAYAELDEYRTGVAGHLRLGGGGTALAMLLAPAAARLRGSHPGLTVNLSEGDVEECIAHVLADRLDIGILVPTPDGPNADDPRFEQHLLLQEPMDLLVPVDHAVTHQDSVRLADAQHETWITARDRSDQNRLLLSACAAAGFTPRIDHHARSWFAAISLVAHGFGVCMIPRLAPASHAVTRIRLADRPAPSRQVLALTRRGGASQSAVAHALHELREISRSYGVELGGDDKNPSD
jgi:DNA-binding transcriptional LysR family regulator